MGEIRIMGSPTGTIFFLGIITGILSAIAILGLTTLTSADFDEELIREREDPKAIMFIENCRDVQKSWDRWDSNILGFYRHWVFLEYLENKAVEMGCNIIR